MSGTFGADLRDIIIINKHIDRALAYADQMTNLTAGHDH